MVKYKSEQNKETKMGKGPYPRSLHSAAGNGSLLVVTDSGASWGNWNIVKETVLLALEHFGFPYRTIDLAKQRLEKADLTDCAALVLAQDRIGASLTEKEADLISSAVKETGLGLVVLDPDLRSFPRRLLEIFGFNRINPAPYTTDTLLVNDNSHYITGMQNCNEFHRFDRMVSAIMVEEWGAQTTPLVQAILGKEQLILARHLVPNSAFMPGNYPVLFAARYGKGKAIQFTISPRIWRRGFFGHCRGIDDLFWRSIVWAAAKPFAANIIPPFVAISFDDCGGRHDFIYADLLGQYGYIPMVSLFLKDVPAKLFPKIQKGLKSGAIQFNAHAFDYYNLMLYDFGRGEHNKETLKRIFAFEDAWWKKIGAFPGHTVRGHWGEYGVAALPFLKERQRTYFCPLHGFGLLKSDYCSLDGYWPYNLSNCHYDYLPDDNDIYGFAAHSTRGNEDFLGGATVILGENSVNDIEKAAGRAVSQVAHGLRAGFFAEMLTHEQRFNVLSLQEWERILKRIEELSRRYERIPTDYDQIGPYLKGKDGAWISLSARSGNKIKIQLAGKTNVPLKISVFKDEGETVNRTYRTIKPFEGTQG